jgi:hypothetical protein
MSLPVIIILPSQLQMSWDFKGYSHDLLQDNLLPFAWKGFQKATENINIKINIFCNVTPYWLLSSYQHFKGSRSIHFQEPASSLMTVC